MQRACRIRTVLTVVLTAAAVVSAHAQEDACAAFAWPLAREQALLSAAILSNAETGGRIRPNEAYLVRLRPMGDVAFALAPERKPKIAESFGGIVSLDAPAGPGLYQITLSDEAWIDVVQKGARLKSGAFSGKQGCASMRKSVRFEFAADPVLIQISGSAADRVRLVVAPAE